MKKLLHALSALGGLILLFFFTVIMSIIYLCSGTQRQQNMAEDFNQTDIKC